MFDSQYDPGYQPGASYPRQLTQNEAILARLAGPQTYPETIIPGVEGQYQPGASFPRQMQPQPPMPAFSQAQPWESIDTVTKRLGEDHMRIQAVLKLLDEFEQKRAMRTRGDATTFNN